MNRCLHCYKELVEGEANYHLHCCESLFGATTPSTLPYSAEQIAQIADRPLTPVPLSCFELSTSTLSGEVEQSSCDPFFERFTIYAEGGVVADLTMKLAEALHIVTAPHTLVRLDDGSLRYAIRRVDVTTSGVRIPMEDISQISELSFEERYEGSYEQLMTLIEECSSVNRIDVNNLWEQVVFAWVCGDSDFNLTQIALYEPYAGICSLAPLRFATSHALFDGAKLGAMALEINRKRVGIKRIDLEAAMRESGLKGRAINIIFKKIVAAKPRFMERVDESLLDADQKLSYKKLLEAQIKTLE